MADKIYTIDLTERELAALIDTLAYRDEVDLPEFLEDAKKNRHPKDREEEVFRAEYMIIQTKQILTKALAAQKE